MLFCISGPQVNAKEEDECNLKVNCLLNYIETLQIYRVGHFSKSPNCLFAYYVLIFDPAVLKLHISILNGI